MTSDKYHGVRATLLAINIVLFAALMTVTVMKRKDKDKEPVSNPTRYVVEGKDCMILVREHSVRVECQLEAK